MKNYKTLFIIILSLCMLSENSQADAVSILNRIKNAAIKTITDPLVLVPAFGAAAIYYTNSDKAITNWATKHAPVFSSEKRAGDYSTYLLHATGWSAYIAMPVQVIWTSYNTGDYITPVLTTGISYGISVESTVLLTGYIKTEAGRERPNKADHESFPSLHASWSSCHATLAAESIDRLPISYAGQMIWKGATYACAAGAAWGRVESRWHYTSDVLAGWVLGRIITLFVTESIMGSADEAETPKINIEVNPNPEKLGFAAGLTIPVSI
jgi:membrane-associated phospholipid phosphatase